MNEFLLFKVTGQSLLKTCQDPSLEIPSRPRIRLTGTVRWANWNARVLAFLYSSADRRVLKLVCISKQSFDIASGVHVGKDDLDVGAGDQGIMFGYASDETEDALPHTLHDNTLEKQIDRRAQEWRSLVDTP